MRSLVILVALVASCYALDVEEEENVLVLNNENFQQVVDENEHVLVEFYAPWCGHCKALAPEYAKAATQLNEDGSAIKLAKVDATEESELADRFKVRGYPTIKFMKNGNELDYTGGRTASDIIAWLMKKTGPPAEDLETVDEAKEFSGKAEVVVIGFFSDEDSDSARAYLSAAESDDSLMYGIVTSEEVAKAMEASFDSVVLFKQFDEGRATYDGKFTAEEIIKFVFAEQLPLVTVFSDKTAQKIFGGKVTQHLLSFYSSESDDAEATLEGLRSVAAEFKGKILFVHVDTSEDESSRITDFFNIEEEDIPTVRLVNIEQDILKYVPEFEGIDAEKIKEWITAYVAGELKPHLNTEDVPDDWDQNPVKVLVGKNFADVVYDENVVAFVEFYAPWCGHCKQLAPIWDQLGEHFSDDKEVIIAKVDATKNEVENVSVKGFPTLKFFTKDNEMVDYSGGRTLDDLIQFVEKQVSGGEEEEEEEETPEPDIPKDEL